MPTPNEYALGQALRWAVRDGRAHGLSVCACPICTATRQTLADYEKTEIEPVGDPEQGDRAEIGAWTEQYDGEVSDAGA